MEVKVSNHVQNDRWTLVTRDKIGDHKVIKSIWAFKRKRNTDGSVKKHKARICTHSRIQNESKSYWKTFAPMVAWVTTRLMLAISVACELHTRSIDFVQVCV